MLLALMGWAFLGTRFNLGTESSRLAFGALAASFAITGATTLLLARGADAARLGMGQVVSDQLVWTVLVYISGGVASAATPFYGLTCLAGAIVVGARGAFVGGATALLSFCTLGVGFWSGWLHGPKDQPAEIYDFAPDEIAFHVGVNLLGIVVVSLLAAYLAERLRLTGGKLVEAEARADRAERMAALGRLAMGLAHEIRNPLGSIAGSAQMLGMAPSMAPDDKRLCEIIQREAARLNDLVTDMMDLARPRPAIPNAVDAAGIARDVATLTESSGRGGTDVGVDYRGPMTPLLVTADPALLRQLIWNLVRNAVQASSADERVSLSLSVVGGRVSLVVEDRGVGIEPDAMGRLFDAFFTTRSQGTGVGLAVVKRIADEHGWPVLVESDRGQGARFTLDLGPPLS